MAFAQGARTVLLIVDMDNDNSTGMYSVYNPEEYVANAVRVREACYKAGIPVIQLKQTYERECRGYDAPLNEVRLEDGVTPGASFEGTHGWEIVSALAPGERDIVIRKHRWDGFFGTKLLAVLNSLHAEQLVWIGGFTDACLLTSVFSGYCYDYPTALIADAASCATEPSHKMAVLQMANWVYDCTIFTTDNFARWVEGNDAPFWYSGTYNAIPVRAWEDADGLYAQILAGNSASKSAPA